MYTTFDFGTATWKTSPLPATRGEHAMAADLLGRVFLVGGTVTNTWSYDGDAWTTTLAPSPTSRRAAAVATGSDGLIYQIGGLIGQNATNILDAYDPLLDRWITMPNPLPTARAGLAAVTLGDRIFAIGGWSSVQSGRAANVVEVYDVRTQTWSARSPMPRALADFAAVAAADGRIYVAGGFTAVQLNPPPTAAVAAYDAAADRWTVLRPLSKARSGVAATRAPDGRIYLLGDGMQPNSPVEAYGPVVAVSPSHAPPGASILVTGSNFAANATVHVFLGSPAARTLLKTGASSAAGALLPSITITVPDVASGDKVLTVIDDRSRYPITLAFTVD